MFSTRYKLAGFCLLAGEQNLTSSALRKWCSMVSAISTWCSRSRYSANHPQMYWISGFHLMLHEFAWDTFARIPSRQDTENGPRSTRAQVSSMLSKLQHRPYFWPWDQECTHAEKMRCCSQSIQIVKFDNKVSIKWIKWIKLLLVPAHIMKHAEIWPETLSWAVAWSRSSDWWLNQAEPGWTVLWDLWISMNRIRVEQGPTGSHRVPQGPTRGTMQQHRAIQTCQGTK